MLGSIQERADEEAVQLKKLQKELRTGDVRVPRPHPKSEDTETSAVRVPLPVLRHTLNNFLSVELDKVFFPTSELSS